MIFKDRQDAGERLAGILKNAPYIKRRRGGSRVVVASLLRGGIIVGEAIAKNLKIGHLPLAVAKIPAPGNPELAIGALCFDFTYLEPKIVSSLNLEKSTLQKQIGAAREKFNGYVQRFSLKEKGLAKQLKNKVVILTDDGVATGSSMKAAALFIRSQKPKKILLAVPVVPTDFDERGFDRVFILHKEAFFSAVSQFYENFPQLEDEEVKRMLY